MGVAAAPRKAVFHPEAQDEYDEILVYYETERPGVVEAFREELMPRVKRGLGPEEVYFFQGGQNRPLSPS